MVSHPPWRKYTTAWVVSSFNNPPHKRCSSTKEFSSLGRSQARKKIMEVKRESQGEVICVPWQGPCHTSERGRDKRHSQAQGRARQQEPDGSKSEYHRDVVRYFSLASVFLCFVVESCPVLVWGNGASTYERNADISGMPYERNVRCHPQPMLRVSLLTPILVHGSEGLIS